MRRLVLAVALAAAALPVTASNAAPTCVEPFAESPVGDFDGNPICLPTGGTVDCRNLVVTVWQVQTGIVLVYCTPRLEQ
ncbi:MAG TPA: hypothetical protein VGX28_05005 [Frankiaceae bacterium]|jgi:hypothetical protein|nr:hypothetical protein [Frankiaceae bacterium]